MEPSSRLYQCVGCHQQVKICPQCDRGNVYCSPICAAIARSRSLKRAGFRYQATFNGKRNHAARQARYRKSQSKKVTHQGSLYSTEHAPIELIENEPSRAKSEQAVGGYTCCLCKKPISSWLRHDFLRRRTSTKITSSRAGSQSP